VGARVVELLQVMSLLYVELLLVALEQVVEVILKVMKGVAEGVLSSLSLSTSQRATPYARACSALRRIDSSAIRDLLVPAARSGASAA
jgi:hypothetical protein